MITFFIPYLGTKPGYAGGGADKLYVGYLGLYDVIPITCWLSSESPILSVPYIHSSYDGGAVEKNT